MKAMFLFGLLLILPVAAPIAAFEFEAKSQGTEPNIIELYTSQGCSSCPPAEAWLSGLANETGLWRSLFPLAFHVSYWDYLGWKDPFADPAHGKRQYAHWNRKHSNGVYTPQIFIGGWEWRGGEVSSTGAGPFWVKLDGQRLQARFNGQADTLHLAVVGMGLVSAIARGENRDKRLTQDFVVLQHWQFKGTAADSGVHFTEAFELISRPEWQQASRLALVVWVEDKSLPLQALGDWILP
ncbi:DUF1223 domain-containing protein [Shewanella amazonensis]|uniref:Uncharacterized secreted protein n=2 Tax=Shewanella amazonensis TaxID=60478 RepID=A1SAW1_SHEAM|nr:uncharacterized secreted protein [Shewanella amazonensis SB2B]